MTANEKRCTVWQRCVSIFHTFLSLCFVERLRRIPRSLKYTRRAFSNYMGVEQCLIDLNIYDIHFIRVPNKSLDISSCLGIRRGVGSCRVK